MTPTGATLLGLTAQDIGTLLAAVATFAVPAGQTVAFVS